MENRKWEKIWKGAVKAKFKLLTRNLIGVKMKMMSGSWCHGKVAHQIDPQQVVCEAVN
jgi:hypothetical protein